MSGMICILMSIEERRKGRRGLHTFGIRNLYANLWLVFRWWEQRDTGRPFIITTRQTSFPEGETSRSEGEQ